MEQNKLIQSRTDKLEALNKLGISAYSGRYPKTESLQALVEGFVENRQVTTAGRLSAKRGHGGLVFVDIRDTTGKIQLCIKKDHVDPDSYRLFQLLDLGDIIGAEGSLFKTRTGEISVQVKTLKLLTKSMRPLPEKWHGLKDVEIRYRKRYLDLIANESVRQVFVQRSKLLSSLRSILEREGYLEVETPMMHAIAGGAAGDPFITHHNALDMDLYLRLAPELDLKKLLVGGLERVYELNRSFRNEGLSTQHNPEFTMLEVYAAYQDCEYMMELVEKLITEAAKSLLGSLQFEFRGKTIDLSPPWERVSFAETMKEMGLSADSPLKEIQAALEKKGMKVKGMSRSQLVRLVEQLFEPQTKTKPLYVVDYWTELSPLAKCKPDNPLIADRFELFIGGMEVANAYSELNDPAEQRRRFETQLDAAGAKGAARVIDETFLDALEHGMPPAGGLGIGIDRLAMLLLSQPSIKDVILFPQLKPIEQGQGARDEE